MWAVMGVQRTLAYRLHLPPCLRAVGSRALHSGGPAWAPVGSGSDPLQPAGAQPADSTGTPSAGQPPAQPPQRHWLDHYFPGMRQWLEDKNREWWIKGLVQARCKQYHQLEGRQQVLRMAIEAEYQTLHDRHAGRIVDDRSETHLQMACLALATHKALLPFLRDEQEVLQIVSDQMGAHTSPALSFLMKAVKFLHRDAFATLCNRLRALQWDYGRGFTSDLALGEREASLTITSCFYHGIFEAEGQPQLTACTCCSQDQIWMQAVQYRGVEAGLESSIARGDTTCCFSVRRVGGGGGG